VLQELLVVSGKYPIKRNWD